MTWFLRAGLLATAWLLTACSGTVGGSSGADGATDAPRPTDATLPDGPAADVPRPQGDGPTAGDGPAASDSAVASDSEPPPSDGPVQPPPKACGDGVADRTFDAAKGWYVEECDEGALNGTGREACGTDCRYRSCDSGRPCGPLRSTFGAYFPSSEAELAALLLSMREMGYEEFIPVNIGAQLWKKSGSSFTVTGVQDAYYKVTGSSSVLSRHLALAAKAGIKVIVGLAGLVVDGGYDWEVWLNASRRQPFVEHTLDLAAEVIKQVGGSPAFAGFYLPGEMNLGQNLCTEAGDFYAQLIGGAYGRTGLRAQLNSRGGGLITIAPYLAVAGQSAATIGARLRCVFDKAKAVGGLDRIMVQDGVPKAAEGFTTLNNVKSYFAAMWSALAAADREVLWVDLETYAWPNAPCTSAPGGSRPATIARIGDQVREVGRYVGGFSQWIHAHNFRASKLGSDACDPDRTALGQAYITRPFPFHGFNYNSHVILRGYRLLPAGAIEVSCPTASGTQTLSFNQGSGLAVHYAASWLSDADVPDPSEVYEVSLPVPAVCTGAMQVSFVNPGGSKSSTLSIPL